MCELMGRSFCDGGGSASAPADGATDLTSLCQQQSTSLIPHSDVLRMSGFVVFKTGVVLETGVLFKVSVLSRT